MVQTERRDNGNVRVMVMIVTGSNDDVLLVQVQGTALLNLPWVKNSGVEAKRFVKSVARKQLTCGVD